MNSVKYTILFGLAEASKLNQMSTAAYPSSMDLRDGEKFQFVSRMDLNRVMYVDEHLLDSPNPSQEAIRTRVPWNTVDEYWIYNR